MFAASTDEIGKDLFTIKADGSGLTQLTGPGGFDSVPAWSPDGKRIAFTSNIGTLETNVTDYNIFVMDADGSNIEQLTTSPNWDHAPKWSPDGKWLVYYSGPWVPDEPWHVYRVHVETKEVVRVTPNEGRDAHWVWAGKSRFLSVDPAGKKKAPWGTLKAEEPTAPQETPPDAE